MRSPTNKLFLALFLLVPFSLPITAYGDHVESMDSYVLKNPVTCVFEPTGGFKAGVFSQSLQAIHAWQYNLQKYTSNSNGWLIPIVPVTEEEQKRFDSSICDITVRYFDHNSEYYGYMHYSDPSAVKEISIYQNDLTASQIGVIVEHEFGHALGVGHYIKTDAAGRQLIDLDSPYFDVMMPEHDFMYDKPFIISHDDLNVLIEKYGQHGFGNFYSLTEP